MNAADQDYTMAFVDSIDRVPVLMIHGFPLSSRMWDLQIADLADMARLLAPDLRGFGDSAPTPPGFGLDRYAADCLRLLDDRGLDGPVVVVGLSMGGYIALELFRQAPERVGALVLTATRAGADSPQAQADRKASAEKVAAEGTGPLVEGMLTKLLAPGRLEDEPELAEFLRSMMEESSVEGVVGALLAMKDRPDSTPLLADIDVPTLIVHGADDQLIPVSEAEAMHRAIEDSELVVLADAGHMPNLEQPEPFAEALRAFLSQFYDD